MNNRGWGLRVMIALCSVLIAAFFIVIIIIYTSFFGLFESTSKENSQIDQTRTYDSMKLDMITATKKYIKKIYNNELEQNDSLYIKISSLQNEKMLKTLYDVKDDGIECSGYVRVTKKFSETIYEPYMKCGSNYVTNNYKTRFDG